MWKIEFLIHVGYIQLDLCMGPTNKTEYMNQPPIYLRAAQANSDRQIPARYDLLGKTQKEDDGS